MLTLDGTVLFKTSKKKWLLVQDFLFFLYEASSSTIFSFSFPSFRTLLTFTGAMCEYDCWLDTLLSDRPSATVLLSANSMLASVLQLRGIFIARNAGILVILGEPPFA